MRPEAHAVWPPVLKARGSRRAGGPRADALLVASGEREAQRDGALQVLWEQNGWRADGPPAGAFPVWGAQGAPWVDGALLVEVQGEKPADGLEVLEAPGELPGGVFPVWGAQDAQSADALPRGPAA